MQTRRLKTAVVATVLALTAVFPFSASAAQGDVVSVGCATQEMSTFTILMPNTVGGCIPRPTNCPAVDLNATTQCPGDTVAIFLGTDPRQVNFEGTFISQKSTNGGMFLECTTTGWTAFTDGLRTWIMGPFGVLVRDNNHKLPYPYDQACIPPPGPGSSSSSPQGQDPFGLPPTYPGLSGGGCTINSAVINGSSNVNVVAIAGCGSNASATINISQNSSSSTGTTAAPSGSSAPSTTTSNTPSTTSGGSTTQQKTGGG